MFRSHKKCAISEKEGMRGSFGHVKQRKETPRAELSTRTDLPHDRLIDKRPLMPRENGHHKSSRPELDLKRDCTILMDWNKLWK